MDKEVKIVTDEKILNLPSYEIDTKKENSLLTEIVLALKDTLRSHPEGIGLSAIQIGYNKRVFVIRFGNEYSTFVNPIISKFSKPTWSIEGCLSIPNERYAVMSFDEIEAFYQTPLGKNMSVRLRGAAARVFLYEYNHLNGLTIKDHGLEWSDELDKLSEEEKQALFMEFAKTLDEKQKEKEKDKNATSDANTNTQDNNKQN